jgi:hypothetical protein
VRAVQFLIVLLVAASQLVVAAQGPPQASESDVKAAYLFQFSKYVEWPATSTVAADTITMCVVGDTGVAGALQKIARDEAAAGRRIVVQQDPDVPHAADCRILFVARGEDQRLAALAKALERKPTLIAGDDESFLRHGGMVAFFVQDRKLRFSISLAAADAAHLKISSQLLRHAVQVMQ